jgi:hypothetical protein
VPSYTTELNISSPVPHKLFILSRIISVSTCGTISCCATVLLPLNTTVSNNVANSLSQLTLNIYLYISSFAKLDHVYAHWIACITNAFFSAVSSDTTVHVNTDKAISNHHVFETTFHTFGILSHRLVTCDFMFVQFSVNHDHGVIVSAVTILGVGTIYHAVFINTQLYVQSILGVTVRFAAFV